MTSPTPGKFARFKGTTAKIWRLSLPAKKLREASERRQARGLPRSAGVVRAEGEHAPSTPQTAPAPANTPKHSGT